VSSNGSIAQETGFSLFGLIFFLSYFLNTLTQSVTANKYIIFSTQNTPPIPYLSSYTVWPHFIRENQNFALYSVHSARILYEIELEKPKNTCFFQGFELENTAKHCLK